MIFLDRRLFQLLGRPHIKSHLLKTIIDRNSRAMSLSSSLEESIGGCHTSPKERLYELGERYRNDWSDFDGRVFESEVCCIADDIHDNIDAQTKLYNLGAAYWEDWSQVDGRTVQRQLDDIADSL